MKLSLKFLGGHFGMATRCFRGMISSLLDSHDMLSCGRINSVTTGVNGARDRKFRLAVGAGGFSAGSFD